MSISSNTVSTRPAAPEARDTSNTQESPKTRSEEELSSDPREQISYGVLMDRGKLAPRSFESWEEAQAWAQEGEQVVAWNFVCGCDR